MVALENEFLPSTTTAQAVTDYAAERSRLLGIARTFYFCIPQNDKLLGYWDTVEDRLFKIRHCMNIEGVVRQLPLFEPPTDPALLVRATALASSSTPAPHALYAPPPSHPFASILTT